MANNNAPPGVTTVAVVIEREKWKGMIGIFQSLRYSLIFFIIISVRKDISIAIIRQSSKMYVKFVLDIYNELL